MMEPKQRIIVDGVDFAEIIRFPKVLGAVLSAMQPSRLVVGLLMVTTLITAGRLWDGFTTPRIPPGGFSEDRWTEQQDDAVQDLLRSSLQEYVPESQWPVAPGADWPTLDGREVMAQIRHHAALAVASEEGAEPAAETGQAARPRFDRIQVQTRLKRINMERPRGTFERTATHARDALNRVADGGRNLQFMSVWGGLKDLVIGLPTGLWKHDKLFTLLYGLLFLFVFALGGGALARMAACQLSMRERLGVWQGIEFAITNWPRLILTPVMPIIVAVILGVFPVLLGLLMRVPVLDVLGAIAYGVSLLVGFLLAFILLGYGFGFSLLIPAAATERCEPFDAQQRAYAYVVQRPLHLLGYSLVALVGLILGYLVVRIVALAMLNLTADLFDLTAGGHPASANAGHAQLFQLVPGMPQETPVTWHGQAADWIIALWQTIVICLVGSYVFSYFFSATTTIYLLMRRVCDGEEIEQIWRPGLEPGTLAPVATAAPAEAAGDSDQTQDEAPDNSGARPAASGDSGDEDGEP